MRSLYSFTVLNLGRSFFCLYVYCVCVCVFYYYGLLSEINLDDDDDDDALVVSNAIPRLSIACFTRTLRSGLCYRNSICRLSSVCNVGAPYSGGLNLSAIFLHRCV